MKTKKNLTKASRIQLIIPALCTVLADFAGASGVVPDKAGVPRLSDVSRALDGYNYVIESNSRGGIESVVVSGQNGSGKNVRLAPDALANVTVGKIAMRMAAGHHHPASGRRGTIRFKETLQGQAAVDALGQKLPMVAAEHGMAAEKFRKILLTDPTAWLDRTGRMFYKDAALPPPAQAEAEAAKGPTIAAAPPFALANTFKLHSRPGSQRVVYLDFNGHTATGTVWNDSYGIPTINAPAFNVSGTPETFDDEELELIQQIWRRVAEDFSSFELDITTEEPPAAALERTSPTDLSFGTRAVITTNVLNCECGGYAYIGTFDEVGPVSQPVWVFYDVLGDGNEKYVGEATSHEVGHTLGLSHDGSSTSAYYSGHGDGETGWAPIMGSSYTRELTQWSMGEYPDANNQEDDLAIMPSHGAAIRVDDAGNTIATARSLGGTLGGSTFTVDQSGIIEQRSDLDVFAFSTSGGEVKLDVAPAPRGGNLDIRATLFSADGNVVARSNPALSVTAGFDSTLAAGTYFLRIDGAGKTARPDDPGYSDYATLGQYQITGSFPQTASTPPPEALATALPATGTVPLSVSLQSSATTSASPIVSYQWEFGDGFKSSEPNPQHIYQLPGTYEALLTVTDANGKSSENKVRIVVNPAAADLSLRVSKIGMGLSGTSTSVRASATVTVTNGRGEPVTGALVTGKWSGLATGTDSAATLDSGMVRLNSPRAPLQQGTFTFTVTGVSLQGYTYDPTRNAKTVGSISQ